MTRLAGAVLLACALCFASAPAAWCFPWSIDMFRGAAVQPQSVAPRVMPLGTMPVNGGPPPMTLEQMTVKLHNPYKPTPARLAHGKMLFDNTCEPCHGMTGAGDGPVVHLLRHKPANLTTGVSTNLPDGYIYGYIRNGGIWMPSYDDAMSSEERWDVVMYVRELEKEGKARMAAAKTKGK